MSMHACMRLAYACAGMVHVQSVRSCTALAERVIAYAECVHDVFMNTHSVCACTRIQSDWVCIHTRAQCMHRYKQCMYIGTYTSIVYVYVCVYACTHLPARPARAFCPHVRWRLSARPTRLPLRPLAQHRLSWWRAPCSPRRGSGRSQTLLSPWATSRRGRASTRPRAS